MLNAKTHVSTSDPIFLPGNLFDFTVFCFLWLVIKSSMSSDDIAECRSVTDIFDRTKIYGADDSRQKFSRLLKKDIQSLIKMSKDDILHVIYYFQSHIFQNTKATNVNT